MSDNAIRIVPPLGAGGRLERLPAPQPASPTSTPSTSAAFRIVMPDRFTADPTVLAGRAGAAFVNGR